MEIYEKPSIEVIYFDNQDIVTTSKDVENDLYSLKDSNELPLFN